MDKKFTWTVDVESDWGGRVNEYRGIEEGIPKIIQLFTKYNIKALFFVSTEVCKEYPDLLKGIRDYGHEVGSHGHFHTIYKEDWRKESDRQLSIKLIANNQSIPKESIRYRAPKFNFKVSGQLYSDRTGHIGLLKHMWLGTKIPTDPIFYLHPFDVVKGNNPPNLFCSLWYSKPNKALQLLDKLIQQYPGEQRLT